MPKFKTEHFKFEDKENRDEPETLEFSSVININAKGEFYTNIPQEIVEKFKAVGIDVGEKNNRNKNGLFSARAYEDLLKTINLLGEDYVTKEIVSETVKIEYAVETDCIYTQESDGTVFPNGYYIKNNQTDSYWRDGTKNNSRTMNPVIYGFQIYADVFLEKIYRYRTGRTFSKKFFNSSYFASDIGENGKWLNAIVRQKTADATIREIEYTEEIAGFFRQMFETLFHLNERIKGNFTPENVRVLASRNGKLLTGFGE